jgi:hypothetical protein
VAEQVQKQLASAEARLGEEIAGVEARAKERSDLAHACIAHLRDEVFGILRARDDERELRRLDDEAAALFRSLHQADLSKYRNDNAWLVDYGKWKSAITRFWDILRGYSESVGQPFQFTDTDLDGRNDVPNQSLFAADDMRRTYQFMLVANDRHTELRRNAFQFMAEKGKPPRTMRESA